MSAGDVMQRNALAFDCFCRDVEKIGGKVTVGLSGTGIQDPKEPPHDPVIRIVTSGTRISTRVPGPIVHKIAELRERLNLA